MIFVLGTINICSWTLSVFSRGTINKCSTETIMYAQKEQEIMCPKAKIIYHKRTINIPYKRNNKHILKEQ
jgi:hypothetical protein